MHRLLRAPTWLIGLLFGVPFGAAVAILVKASGDTTTASLLFGLAAGVLIGLTTALASRRPRRELRQVLDQLPVADWKTARTAAWRGPAPTRPDIRATALALVDLRLRTLRRTRTWFMIVIGLNLVIALVNLTFGTWGYGALAVGWTALLAEQWYAPRRLHRRREILTAEQTLP